MEKPQITDIKLMSCHIQKNDICETYNQSMAKLGKKISQNALGMLPWILWWFLGNLDLIEGSVGDRSYIYQRCLRSCRNENCTKAASLQHFQETQSWIEGQLYWSCENECQYQCMWKTVEAFQKDDIAIPQFHGKVGYDIQEENIVIPLTYNIHVMRNGSQFYILPNRKPQSLQ